MKSRRGQALFEFQKDYFGGCRFWGWISSKSKKGFFCNYLIFRQNPPAKFSFWLLQKFLFYKKNKVWFQSLEKNVFLLNIFHINLKNNLFRKGWICHIKRIFFAFFKREDKDFNSEKWNSLTKRFSLWEKEIFSFVKLEIYKFIWEWLFWYKKKYWSKVWIFELKNGFKICWNFLNRK